MRVALTRSGGFAGVRLRADVDEASLAPGEARALRGLVSAAGFFGLPARLGAATRPDRFEYRIHVEDGPLVHEVVAAEAEVPASLWPLIDWLVDRARRG